MSKNIELNIKLSNGNYDILYMKNLFDNNILSSELCTLLGLNSTDTPTQAFKTINTLLNNIQSVSNEKSKITNGSYYGLGKYGSSNKNTITFEFTPKFVVVSKVNNTVNNLTYPVKGMILEYFMYPVNYSTKAYFASSTTYYGLQVSWSTKKLSWYVIANGYNEENKPSLQLNELDAVYYYIGIG